MNSTKHIGKNEHQFSNSSPKLQSKESFLAPISQTPCEASLTLTPEPDKDTTRKDTIGQYPSKIQMRKSSTKYEKTEFSHGVYSSDARVFNIQVSTNTTVIQGGQ